MVISRFPWEIVMLEHYYFRPETVDRIRASWLAPAIEQYVSWLTEAHYTARSVLHRVPVLMSVGGGANPTLNGGARLSKSVNNGGQSLAPVVERAGR
jgi:hypothetical protein